jgi:uncharacterized protein (TIGR01244 family)
LRAALLLTGSLQFLRAGLIQWRSVLVSLSNRTHQLTITSISENYAVTAQILADDVAAIATEGFVAVICNRPDGEEPGQPTAAEISAACAAAGIAFHHIPVSGMPIAIECIQEQRRLINDSAGPVLGYCRSGQRSQIIWQASA